MAVSVCVESTTVDTILYMLCIAHKIHSFEFFVQSRRYAHRKSEREQMLKKAAYKTFLGPVLFNTLHVFSDQIEQKSLKNPQQRTHQCPFLYSHSHTSTQKCIHAIGRSLCSILYHLIAKRYAHFLPIVVCYNMAYNVFVDARSHSSAHCIHLAYKCI